VENVTLLELISGKFPDAVVETGEGLDQPWVILKKESVAAVCRFLKDNADTKMDYLIDITAVDFLPKAPRFEVVYHMRSIKHGHKLRLKARVEEDDPTVPTVSSIWLTADWHERETFDLMGVKFEGHPNLTRILMTDDWEGHPLRKDYPIKGPEWTFKPW